MSNAMEFKRRIKQAAFYACDSKCCICGFDEDYCGLYDFHHLDPEEKEFGLNTITCKIETAIEEIKKCIMICPICHRKIHYGIITEIPNSCFSEDKFWEKYNELSPQGAHQRELQKMEKPTREELKNLIRNQTMTSVAEKYNVSIAAIKKWCIKFNLPHQKGVIKQFSDEEWLNI